MTATILHISDLHFGDPMAALNRIEVGKVICSLLGKAGPDVSLVLLPPGGQRNRGERRLEVTQNPQKQNGTVGPVFLHLLFFLICTTK